MGIFSGLRARLAALSASPEVEAATLADIETVRRAVRAEAARLGRRRRLSVTMLMEHSAEDLRRLDLFQIIAHLAAEGELQNVEQDSFGNLKFDLGEMASQAPPGAPTDDRTI